MAASTDTGTPVQVQKITSAENFTSAKSSLAPQTLLVLYFHAPWAAPCQQMSAALDALASTYRTTGDSPSIAFLSVDAEEIADVAETYEVPAVPYVVLQRHGRTLDAISGCDPARVRASVEKYFSSEGRGGGDGTGTGSGTKKVDLPPAQTVVRPPPSTTADVPPASTKDGEVKENGGSGKDDDNSTETQEQLHNRLGELVKAAPVMLFMKGTPSAPQCGFSRQTVSILREKGIRYGFFNILADDDVRQGLKEYADWPTYPQVWVDGELAGGLDIIKEEFESDPDFLMRYSVKGQKT